MTSPVNPYSSLIQPASSNSSSSAASTSENTNAAINATNSLGNENTFLQLLVAQIKNQDPTQPVDSSTFLTQLAEFSQLEQLIGIRQDVSQLDPVTGAPSTSSTTGTGSTPGTQS
jgi:flagellar basal-body rod modification protein FlgD